MFKNSIIWQRRPFRLPKRKKPGSPPGLLCILSSDFQYVLSQSSFYR